jgi:FkbM family methyltransferase
VEGGRRLYVDLRSAIGRGMLVTGQFDRALGDFLRKTLQPGDTFVDVGANVGVFSLIALERVGEKGLVHAFEVDPRALRCLTRTQQANGLGNLIVHNTALGATAGLMSIVQSAELGDTYMTQPSDGALRFPLEPLDAWLDHFRERGLRLVKVDVEGAELEVLSGAERVLRTCRPIVVCEAVESHQARFGRSVADLIAFMTGLGYNVERLAGVNDPTIVFGTE